MENSYSQAMIDRILSLHTEWTHSDGARGRRAILLGHLSGADLYNADLRYAIMDHVNLVDANLRNARLNAASMRRATLYYADLSGANLSGADLCCASLGCTNLQNANLQNADLRGADLDTAKFHGANLAGVNAGVHTIPTVDCLDEKILKIVESGEGQLDMSDWHNDYCKTTHCRAGWAIELAGPDGYELEYALGPSAAGSLIYYKSTGHVPDFYTDARTAFEDMRARSLSGTL